MGSKVSMSKGGSGGDGRLMSAASQGVPDPSRSDGPRAVIGVSAEPPARRQTSWPRRRAPSKKTDVLALCQWIPQLLGIPQLLVWPVDLVYRDPFVKTIRGSTDGFKHPADGLKHPPDSLKHPADGLNHGPDRLKNHPDGFKARPDACQ